MSQAFLSSGIEHFRIALLDDHAIVRYGLAKRFEEDGRFEVVGSYGDSRSLLEGLRTTPADVLLIDYALGPNEIDGVTLIRALRSRFPTTKLIVLSALNDRSIAMLAERAGAHAFLGKELAPAELVRRVRSVMLRKRNAPDTTRVPAPASGVEGAPGDGDAAGRQAPQAGALACTASDDTCAWVNGPCPVLRRGEGEAVEQRRLLQECLTPREVEVLRCFFEGLTVSEIGAKFRRSPKTISAQKASAYRKLGIRSDREFFKVWGLGRLDGVLEQDGN
ncbi:response regulator transcription factor [Chitinasiproducens palmae]|uniref:DNA-binding response regulator, NarL/FixJ family, contains REC and HTH domains n=1 Tax=Chitinasiproducens palmae TaxID=1770053 RepID=A0A1H2PJ15_9BURK|nr:response regulator transcription factor [Chitinasiproducens palmae]SDV46298.1 DNA-binding response regulator, NarL/FixJ family, contains REC and HTH domains [Chitinasiproducens palmae]